MKGKSNSPADATTRKGGAAKAVPSAHTLGRPPGKKPRVNTGFVGIPRKMLNSQAYIDLPASAGKALPYLLDKPQISYADARIFATTFAFSYGEGKRYGFAPSTFSNVLWRLVRHGFIDPVVRGGLRGEKKTTSTFCVSRRWERYGQADFLTAKYDKKTRLARKSTTPVSVNIESHEPTRLAFIAVVQ